MKREILVLGDSHAAVFRCEQMSAAFPDYRFEVVAVGGATASGLPNPNPVSQAMPRFRAALDATGARIVIVMLGEVDTGFVIWYRAEKHRASVENMCGQALANYQRFLCDVAERFAVVCVSTPLPTIRDGTDFGEVANLRREVRASQRERTALTLSFNRAMQEFCAGRSIPYLMLDDECLGEDGLLQDALRNTDPNDHHYDSTRHALLIGRQLRPALASLPVAAANEGPLPRPCR